MMYYEQVTILILIDGFLQSGHVRLRCKHPKVTILILIDGFLQLRKISLKHCCLLSHNPYFNRWFSAILKRGKLKKGT